MENTIHHSSLWYVRPSTAVMTKFQRRPKPVSLRFLFFKKICLDLAYCYFYPGHEGMMSMRTITTIVDIV